MFPFGKIRCDSRFVYHGGGAPLSAPHAVLHADPLFVAILLQRAIFGEEICLCLHECFSSAFFNSSFRFSLIEAIISYKVLLHKVNFSFCFSFAVCASFAASLLFSFVFFVYLCYNYPL